MQEGTVHEGVQRALSSPLSTSGNGSMSPLPKANSAGLPLLRPLHSACALACDPFEIHVTTGLPEQACNEQLALMLRPR